MKHPHIKNLDSKNPQEKLEYNVPIPEGANKSNLSAYQFASEETTGTPHGSWQVQPMKPKVNNNKKEKFDEKV